MLALTSSHSSSSPGVESNQSSVTCFDLIGSHRTRIPFQEEFVYFIFQGTYKIKVEIKNKNQMLACGQVSGLEIEL